MKSSLVMMGVLAVTLVALTVVGPNLHGSPAADGAALYKKHCVMCHGADGKGFKVLKTPDMTSAQWQASVKDADIANVTKNGKKGTTMPAFKDKLSDDDVKALVAHIRSLSGKKK